MKSIDLTYRIIALFLVGLVFMSSVGFTVDIHYCNGELKSFNLIGKAKPCHDPTLKQCPFHKKMMKSGSAEKSNCCQNKTFHFQSDQDQQVQTFDYELTQPLQLLISTYINVFFINSGIEKELLAFTRYKPPIIQRDIPVLIQSFLL